MKRLLFLLALLLSLAAPSLADVPLPPEIENEQTLGENKQPWHATLMPYATMGEALRAIRADSPFARSLNGQWKFHWVRRPEQRPVDFYRPDFDDSQWKTIPVPSNWQLLGYGTPYYRNIRLHVSARLAPRHEYAAPRVYRLRRAQPRRQLPPRASMFPADWNGRRVFLSFDGVDCGFFLWVNGQKVGYSVNSRNMAEFDITPFLKPGHNLLAAEVYRYCSGSYVEDQDMWRLSGIFRNVTLWSVPECPCARFSH